MNSEKEDRSCGGHTESRSQSSDALSPRVLLGPGNGGASGGTESEFPASSKSGGY